MPYLYKPPTWRNRVPMGGALNPGFPVSTTVYRRDGVWHNVMVAGVNDVDDIDVEPRTGLRLFFTKPMVVPDDIYAELAALAPADPSWSPGTLTPL